MLVSRSLFNRNVYRVVSDNDLYWGPAWKRRSDAERHLEQLTKFYLRLARAAERNRDHNGPNDAERIRLMVERFKIVSFPATLTEIEQRDRHLGRVRA